MTDNYSKIVRNNLNRLYGNLKPDLAKNLPAEQEGDRFVFDAFGEKCRIEPDGIALGDNEHTSVLGILISLYALNARPDSCVLTPLKAFKEFPNSMPYVGAFATHTEQSLAHAVPEIRKNVRVINEKLNGVETLSGTGGDFSFIVFPLPKIALSYIFYEADDEFPASVKCLYSNNAGLFLPVDGLADVGEYTSRTILKLIENS